MARDGNTGAHATISANTTVYDVISLASKEHATVSYRPRLTITYH